MRIDARRSTLLVIDFQTRLMPAIDDGANVVAQALHLTKAAALVDVPVLFTEQNPRGLGSTVEALAPAPENVIAKMSFDSSRAPGLMERLPGDHALILAGCEAHVCVLQTALGLIEAKRRVFVVADAIGSRKPASKSVALERLARNGAEIVTTEMVLFEWLGDANHPRFRDVVALIK